MKIRILDNSIRIRLSKSEVAKLAETGIVESRTTFAGGMLTYALCAHPKHSQLEATYEENRITVYAPMDFLNAWPHNSIVGMDARQKTNQESELYLLIEKDFKCLDNSTEDQTDHYENPSSIC